MYNKHTNVTLHLLSIILLLISLIMIRKMFFTQKESFDLFKIQEFKGKYEQWKEKVKGVNELNINEYLQEVNEIENSANEFLKELYNDLQNQLQIENKTKRGVRIYENKNEILK